MLQILIFKDKSLINEWSSVIFFFPDSICKQNKTNKNTHKTHKQNNTQRHPTSKEFLQSSRMFWEMNTSKHLPHLSAMETTREEQEKLYLSCHRKQANKA